MKYLALEERVARAWLRRSHRDVSVYVRSASRPVPNLSERRVRKAGLSEFLRKSSVILLGDDQSYAMDQVTIVQKLKSVIQKGTNWVFLTDRLSHASALSMMDSRKSVMQVLNTHEDPPSAFSEPFSGWLRLLEFVRGRKMSVDTVAYRKDLRAVDADIAEKISQYQSSGVHVVLWTGALRLRPMMLPKQLNKLKVDYRAWLLHFAEARWSLGSAHGYAVLNDRILASLHTSPLMINELHRLDVEGSRSYVRPDDLRKTCVQAGRKIAKIFGSVFHDRSLTVLEPFTTEGLKAISRYSPKSELGRFIFSRMYARESATLIHRELILLSSLELGHIAEEAAHFIRMRTQKRSDFSQSHVELEEAFAFFASKLIDSTRKVPSPPQGELSEWEGIHYRGYLLGQRLYEEWKSSGMRRKKIKAFWKLHIRTADHARDVMRMLWAL